MHFLPQKKAPARPFFNRISPSFFAYSRLNHQQVWLGVSKSLCSYTSWHTDTPLHFLHIILSDPKRMFKNYQNQNCLQPSSTCCFPKRSSSTSSKTIHVTITILQVWIPPVGGTTTKPPLFLGQPYGCVIWWGRVPGLWDLPEQNHHKISCLTSWPLVWNEGSFIPNIPM